MKIIAINALKGQIVTDMLRGRWVSDYGLWLTQWVPEVALHFFLQGVIFFEIFAAFLLFVPRIRKHIILLGIALHCGLMFLFRIYLLNIYLLWSLAILFPSPFSIQRFINRIGAIRK
jgi:hypothetical protein